MTTLSERTRAVLAAKEFLYELANPRKTPRVPLELRRRAVAVLHHFPLDCETVKGYRLESQDRGEPLL